MSKNKSNKKTAPQKQVLKSGTSSSSNEPNKNSKKFEDLTDDELQEIDVDQTKYYLDYIIAKLPSSSVDDAVAIELTDTRRFLDVIENRINKKKFAPSDDTVLSNLSTKVSLCRVVSASFNMQCKAEIATKKVEDASKKVADVSEKVADATGKLEDELKHTTDSTLTIMGIFATIITVVLSVVVTSSSWLNNADGASAVVAFVVPNLVAVSVAVAMLGIILADRDKRSKVVRNTWIGITVVVVLASSLLIWWNANQHHLRYILYPWMYQVETVDANGSVEKDGKCQVAKFKIEEGNYEISYKKEYRHEDQTLHFCMKHKKFE